MHTGQRGRCSTRQSSISGGEKLRCGVQRSLIPETDTCGRWGDKGGSLTWDCTGVSLATNSLWLPVSTGTVRR